MRYYYTPNGSEVRGPVDFESLCQLGRDGVLHAGSFICPEGETAWRPFSPSAFSPPSPPPIEVFGPAPTQPAAEQVRETEVVDDESGEKGWIPIILNVITVYAALRRLAHYLMRPPRRVQPDDPNERTWTELAIGVFVLVVLPWWFSLLFRGLNRVIARTVGIILLAVVMEVIYDMEPAPETGVGVIEQTTDGESDARKIAAGPRTGKGRPNLSGVATKDVPAFPVHVLHFLDGDKDDQPDHERSQANPDAKKISGRNRSLSEHNTT